MTDPAGWFVSAGGHSPWSARVFCLPHAGGNARSFLRWQPRFGDEAELIAVCPPGRGHDPGEAVPDIDELVAASAAAIGTAIEGDSRPAYVFGHSLGALVGFEVARRLGEVDQFRHFVASGLMAPSVLPSRRVLEIAQLDGKAFVEALGFFGGLPPELIADEEVYDLLLPGLVADFRMAAGYRYRPGPRLAVNVSLINGRSDPHVEPEGVELWRDECRNEPAFHWTEGGHFYFEEDPSRLTDLLLAIIRADQHVELI